MIRRLRRKLIAIQMVIWTLALAGIILAINLTTTNSVTVRTDAMLMLAADNAFHPILGDAPVPDGTEEERAPEELRGVRVFLVRLDASGAVAEIIGRDDPTDIAVEAEELVAKVQAQAAPVGTVDGYRFLVAEREFGGVIALADLRQAGGLTSQMLLDSLMVAGGAWLVLLAVSCLLARLLVRPVDEAFEKQKRFISDASHELKTPLSVISVNAEVLAGEIGDNKYLTYIQSETERMTALTKSLLTLAQLDASKAAPVFAEFDLTHALWSVALPFESAAFEQDKTYETDIAEGLRYRGNQEQIKQLFAILVDNALKHAGDHGEIKASCRKQDGSIVLAVYNTGSCIPEKERERIFERFYRTDASRSTLTGGYGLGLSIARTICEEHHGRIRVESDGESWTRFVVTL